MTTTGKDFKFFEFSFETLFSQNDRQNLPKLISTAHLSQREKRDHSPKNFRMGSGAGLRADSCQKKGDLCLPLNLEK
jgi:hypothetical protein